MIEKRQVLSEFLMAVRNTTTEEDRRKRQRKLDANIYYAYFTLVEPNMNLKPYTWDQLFYGSRQAPEFQKSLRRLQRDSDALYGFEGQVRHETARPC